jgi:hypothetical protein
LADVVFVTATYRTDLDRFRLLRRSLREVGAAEQFHHLVAVNTEDLELLNDLRAEPNLEIVPTCSLLDRHIERRRAAQHFRRTNRRHWVRGGPIPGWYAQQLVKLAAASRASDAQAIVYWDSDMVAIRPLEHADFIASSGLTRFFVNDDMRGDGSGGWNRASARLLDIDEGRVGELQFIHSPTVFDVRVAQAMLDELSHKSRGGWQATMLAANAFEYPTYGAWVMGKALDQVVAGDPLPTANFYEFEHMWDFRDRATQVIAEGNAKVLGVQSRLHIPPSAYESILAQAWH